MSLSLTECCVALPSDLTSPFFLHRFLAAVLVVAATAALVKAEAEPEAEAEADAFHNGVPAGGHGR